MNDRVERVFGEMLCRSVGKLVMRTYEIDGNPSFPQRLEEEAATGDVLGF